MKRLVLFMALAIGMGFYSNQSFAQYDDPPILVDDGASQPGTTLVISNKRHCIKSNGLPATARCPEINESESSPCPSGACFSWATGCKSDSNLNTPGKESEMQHINNGEFTNPVNESPGNGGFKVRLVEQIVCYKKRQCTCTRNGGGSPFCDAGSWVEYAIARYEATNQPCLEEDHEIDL